MKNPTALSNSLLQSRKAGRATELLFLACAFCITWEKIHWSFGGNVALQDVLAGLFVVSAALALSTDRFLTLANLLDVARRVSVINIIALGMTFVIITGGIDLSVGSASALAGVAGVGPVLRP